MPNFIDLTGRRVGRLLVTARAPNAGHQLRWLCQCDCGNIAIVFGSMIRSGKTDNCGCLTRQRMSAKSTRHGHCRKGTQSREFSAWWAMITRCTYPSQSNYYLYGGRGITVHPDWRSSFEAFLTHIGPMPSEGGPWTLDRIDTNGNYVPGNVRWATRATQAANKRNNKTLTHDGKTLHIAAWSRLTGLSIGTIVRRLKLGWPVDRVLTEVPVMGRNQFTR